MLPRTGGLAPDLIGMGRSGKPDSAYRFADHARYLDAWFDALELEDVILVGYDWGGALAFDWAARHPERVRGIAFFETILKPLEWDEYPAVAQERFKAFRTPGVGERMVLEENVFITQALQRDHAEHRSATPTRHLRRALPDAREPPPAAGVVALRRRSAASPPTWSRASTPTTPGWRAAPTSRSCC